MESWCVIHRPRAGVHFAIVLPLGGSQGERARLLRWACLHLGEGSKPRLTLPACSCRLSPRVRLCPSPSPTREEIGSQGHLGDSGSAI